MLSQEKVKALAKKIDDLIDWKKITGKTLIGGILETIDNWGFPQGIQYLNENYFDKIPEDYQDNVEAAIDAFIADDYEGVLAVIPTTLDEVIDIGAFEDDFEALWLATNFDALIKFIKYYAQKKSKE